MIMALEERRVMVEVNMDKIKNDPKYNKPAVTMAKRRSQSSPDMGMSFRTKTRHPIEIAVIIDAARAAKDPTNLPNI